MADRFVEYAIGSVTKRNIIRRSNDYVLLNEARKKGEEAYRSYFLFDSDINDHFKIRKSVESFTGRIYVDRILFDIDIEQMTGDEVLRKTKIFVEKLSDEWKLQDYLFVNFSGRGFHVTIPDIFRFGVMEETESFKATMQKYFPEADDLYYKASLVRAVNTINLKSNLYKIPLESDELYSSYKQITELAVKPRFGFKRGHDDKFPDYSNYIIKPEKKSLALSFDSSRILTCVQNILNKKPRVGKRHRTIIAMASAYRREGIPAESIFAICKHWLGDENDFSDYEIRKIIKDVFEKGYQLSCSNEVLKEHCESRCVFHKNKNYGGVLNSLASYEESYADFIQSDSYKYAVDFKSFFKLENHFYVFPGEVVGLIGDTGTNKSTLLLNFLLYYKKRTLYINTENSAMLTYRRGLQIKYNMTRQAIEDYYKEKRNGIAGNDFDFLKVYTGRPHVDELINLTVQNDIEILAIDVLDDIKTRATEEYQAQKEIMQGFRDVAAKNLIVIFVHHLSKQGAVDQRGKTKPLTLHDSKGNKVIEDKSDKIIGIEGDRKAIFRKVSSLKFRDEPPFESIIHLNPETYKMSPQ